MVSETLTLMKKSKKAAAMQREPVSDEDFELKDILQLSCSNSLQLSSAHIQELHVLLLQSTATAAAAAAARAATPAGAAAHKARQKNTPGGTTFVVAIASDPTTVLERAEFPTTTPKETLRKCREWLVSRHYDALVDSPRTTRTRARAR